MMLATKREKTRPATVQRRLDVYITATKLEFFEAKILNISKANVVIPADEWGVTGVMTSMPHPGHGSINHTDSQST